MQGRPLDTFDAAYYQRFYHDPQTQAVSIEEQQRLAGFICAYLRYMDIPVKSILDLGCGIGTLLHALADQYPHAHTTGVESSNYLCQEYGWRKGSVQDYGGPGADLVVCSDVLGYLDNTACAAAIDQLAHLTRQVLYLAVLTREDLDVCDTTRTDLNQYTRSARWYRSKLREHFQSMGGGLYLKKPVKYPLWQMEMGA